MIIKFKLFEYHEKRVTLKEYCTRIIDEYKPYAEKGVTMSEIKTLSRGYDHLSYWTNPPEYVIRFNNILLYLISKTILEKHISETNFQVVESSVFVVWNIWLDNNEVGVDLKGKEVGGTIDSITLIGNMFELSEVLNPLKYGHQKRFDL